MDIVLRQERPKDYQGVEALVEAAFANMKFSDQQEHFLVHRLRQSPSFIPELSIVALVNTKLAGHILLTRIWIKNETSKSESLALAPVSVHPEFQRKGIGGKLIREAHRIAKDIGYKSAVLLGHKDYYPRFGYKRLDLFNIKMPFEATAENCMAVELVEGGLDGVNGVVEYDQAFFG